MLVPCEAGQYRFLPGIEPYSAGVVAMPGAEIVHATLAAPVPYRDGFALIDRHLGERGRLRAAPAHGAASRRSRSTPPSGPWR